MLAALLAAVIEAALPSLLAGTALRVASVVALRQLHKEIARFQMEQKGR